MSDAWMPPVSDDRPGAPGSRAAQRRLSRRSVWGTFGVVVVLVLAGVLFTTNARLAGGVDARQPQDFAQLVQAETNRVEKLQAQVEELQSEVDHYTDAQTADLPAADAEANELTAFAAGRLAVTGPGLTVRLWDASPGLHQPSWVTNDDLVVHQQDLQAVINSLWAGGAEAMTLQDQRVISTSAFWCVGNVLRLHGQIYSPPYEVRAIGDPDALMAALEKSPEVQNYLDYVDAIGLGWSVSEESDLELPAYAGTFELRYAVAADTEAS